MRTPKILSLFTAATLSLLGTSSADIFLKFVAPPGVPVITGDATFAGHVDEVVALTFKAGVFQKGQELAKGSGASVGKSEFRPITVFKYIDKASPGLFMACATGARYQSVTLTVAKAPITPSAALAAPPQATGDFFRIVLNDVYVTDVNQDADATDSNNNLVETIQLTYGRIFWYFTPLDINGNLGTVIKGGFDLVRNKTIPAP